MDALEEAIRTAELLLLHAQTRTGQAVHPHTADPWYTPGGASIPFQPTVRIRFTTARYN